MINSQNLNETLKKLDDLSIYQLRELARDIGVHLPTTLRKSELIQKIKEIASGEAKPFVATTKKGRPPKQYQTMHDQKTENRVYDYRDWGKNILPFAEPTINLYKMSDNASFVLDEKKYVNIFDINGVVSIDEAGNGRLHEGDLSQIGQKRIARIEYPVIAKFGIRDGDYVVGRIGESLKDGAYCLFDVKAINNLEYPVIRCDFSQEQAMPVCSLLNLEQLPITKLIAPIGKGQRVLVKSKDFNVPKHFLHTLADDFSKMQKTIYVALDEQPEDFYYSSNQQLEYVLCPFDLSVEKQIYILELAINRAKRLAEQGEDVGLIIEDLFTVARLYSRCAKSASVVNIEEFMLSYIKKILATGRNIQNGGTITLVCGITSNNEIDMSQDLLYEIKKSCNSFVVLNTGTYFGVYDFEISSCYTINQERLLNNQQLQLAYNLRKELEGKSAVEIENLLKK